MKVQKKNLTEILDHLIIDLAWSDEVSFESIEQQTGKTEKQVIGVMRKHLKPSSFKLWRARVNGRKKKHQKRLTPTTPDQNKDC
jgi:uncharacterized protein (TIGR03643 family)